MASLPGFDSIDTMICDIDGVVVLGEVVGVRILLGTFSGLLSGDVKGGFV